VRGEARDLAEQRLERCLERVGLGDRAEARPRQLSGGEQQRVAIARALAMEPQLLMLDEPTSALDPQMRGEVLAVLRALSGTCTLLVVTHEMSFARNVANAHLGVRRRQAGRGRSAGTGDREPAQRTRAAFFRSA